MRKKFQPVPECGGRLWSIPQARVSWEEVKVQLIPQSQPKNPAPLFTLRRFASALVQIKFRWTILGCSSILPILPKHAYKRGAYTEWVC